MATGFVLELLEPQDLILVTRSPDDLADVAARGVEVRYGDFDRPESLPAAFAGAERMLFISTLDIGRRLEQARTAVDAAVAAGIQRIVYTSGLNSTPANPAFVAPEHAGTDDLVRESGVDWTILGNGLYSELRVPFAVQAVATGEYRHNAGSGRTAYVSRVDCAAVAAGTLVQDGHRNVTYDVTGPELHTEAEIAGLIAEVSGRPIEVVELSDEERVAGFIAAGYDEFSAGSAASWGTAIRVGALDGVSSVVPDVTGRPGRTVREVLVQHRDQLLGQDVRELGNNPELGARRQARID
jgi:NAD(P)H dehydrogenase (quinone)